MLLSRRRRRRSRRTVPATAEHLEPRRLLSATYYVSTTGNDLADGRSPQTAWKSLERASGRNWNAGDKLLFEGGKTFYPANVFTSGPELVTNGGFESSFTGWTDTQGTDPANSVITTTSPNSGTSALQLSGAGAAARAQDLTGVLTGNQAYKVAMSTRVENPGSGIRRIGVTFTFQGQSVATFYRGFKNTSWAQTQWEFVAPPVFDKATFWVSRTGDSSTVYADDLSIKSVPNALVFDATDSGTPAAPFTIGSYGVGKARINAGDGIGLWGGNFSGVLIQNLIFNGSWDAAHATGGNAGVGIEFVNTQTGDTKLEYVIVQKCRVTGFHWAGVRVGGWAGKSGFRNVVVTDTVANANGDVGIHIRGEFDKNSLAYSNEKVFIYRCQTYDNAGVPDRGANSGSGIEVTDSTFAAIARCVSHDNGVMNNSPDGGPVGIWAFDSNKVAVQLCESYSNKAGGARDGGGFDLDSGVTNSLVENNYSHDNDGPGYLLGQFQNARPWGRNMIRYNVSQNDGRKNSYGAITLSGAPGPYNVIIEHNTIFMSPSTTGGTASGVRLKYSGTGVNFRNNLFVTTGGVALVDADSTAKFTQFNGNGYWPTFGALKIRWSGTTYNSLEAWRGATAQEQTNAGVATGLVADPQLVSPGTGPALNSGDLVPTLTQYDLQPGSAMINASVALPPPIKGYTASTYDFFGRSLPAGSTPDIGAAEALV